MGIRKGGSTDRTPIEMDVPTLVDRLGSTNPHSPEEKEVQGGGSTASRRTLKKLRVQTGHEALEVSFLSHLPSAE